MPPLPVPPESRAEFRLLSRMACDAANSWAVGPHGPYQHPEMTPAAAVGGAVGQVPAHLFELGVIEVDRARLNELRTCGFPVARSAG